MSVESRRHGTQRGRRARGCRRDSGLCAFSGPFCRSGGTSSKNTLQPAEREGMRCHGQCEGDAREGGGGLALWRTWSREQGPTWIRPLEPRFTHVYGKTFLGGNTVSETHALDLARWLPGVHELQQDGISTAPQNLCKRTDVRGFEHPARQLAKVRQVRVRGTSVSIRPRTQLTLPSPPAPRPCPIPHTSTLDYSQKNISSCLVSSMN